MAGQRKKPEPSGVVSRLADRGEDALTRIMDELGKNSRVTDALSRAVSAKDKVDERTRKTLASIGVAAADEIGDLRGQLERLEKRLAQLEGGAATTRSGSRSTRTPARRSTTSRSGAKKSSGTATRSSSAKKSGSATPSKSSSGSSSSSSSSSGPGAGESAGGTSG